MKSAGHRATRRALLLATCLSISLCASAQNTAAPRVKFATTMGEFVVEVYPDKAPKTVENFLQYVKDKHYDGTVFHRVIDNFMVQGGGFDTSFAEKKTRAPVPHEGREALASGGPRNVVGTTRDGPYARSKFGKLRSSSSTSRTMPSSIPR